jgi:capsular polysaccharide transport system permease protein
MLEMRRHVSVIQALIIRDLMGRFGRNHLGFVWTVLEPMILCVGVILVWSLIKEPTVHGVPLIIFILTGYMPLTLWRHLTNPMVRLLRNYAGLLYHTPVLHGHILVARIYLEFVSSTAAFMVIYFVLTTVGLVHPVEDPGLALAGWIFTAWYFGAMGMVISVVTECWEPAEKFVQPLSYLQLPLSGVFFMVDWAPSYAQKLVLLNPSAHCFEMVRAGFLGEAITTHYDPAYLAVCSAAMTLIGTAALYHVRDRIQTS